MRNHSPDQPMTTRQCGYQSLSGLPCKNLVNSTSIRCAAGHLVSSKDKIYPAGPKTVTVGEYLAASNPLLEAFNQLGEDTSFVQAWQKRDEMVQRFSYAIPDSNAINAIVRNSPVVEIGAGTGYWAHLIQESGGDCIPYDTDPPSATANTNQYHPKQKTFTKVLVGDERVLSQHSDRSLLMVWPPYCGDGMGGRMGASDCMAWRALQHYRGNTLIYVGEGAGGCTASYAFWEAVEKDWRLEQRISIPHWSYVHDEMSIFRRKA